MTYCRSHSLVWLPTFNDSPFTSIGVIFLLADVTGLHIHFQHTPVSHCWYDLLINIVKLSKWGALKKWLSEKFSKHVARGVVLNCQLLGSNLIGDKEVVPNVNMAGCLQLEAWLSFVLRINMHRALAVLVYYDRFLERVALGLHEVPCSQKLWHGIINTKTFPYS